jgi:hypothetical protein
MHGSKENPKGKSAHSQIRHRQWQIMQVKVKKRKGVPKEIKTADPNKGCKYLQYKTKSKYKKKAEPATNAKEQGKGDEKKRIKETKAVRREEVQSEKESVIKPKGSQRKETKNKTKAEN